MHIFLYDSHNKRANIIYWVALTFEISIAFIVRLLNIIFLDSHNKRTKIIDWVALTMNT